jgi:bifunctional non-homologous end joining protein LigD
MTQPRLVRVDGEILKLTNLDKVFYPATGTTKGEVLQYYRRLAPTVLPHLQGRPFTLHRFPSGVEGQDFYQKRCPVPRPAAVEIAPLRDVCHCLLNNTSSLLWAVNLAAIELHVTLAPAARTEHPTALALDLDPGEGTGLMQCARLALRIRERLGRLGLECFPKTSGSKGLHVFVPLDGKATFAETGAFARTLAQALEAETPELVVSRMTRKLRRGKVMVDWSQNSETKTTVCAYSLRATRVPSVSTPLLWREVAAFARGKLPRPGAFGMEETLERIARHGDLFAPVLRLRQRLPALQTAIAGKRRRAPI